MVEHESKSVVEKPYLQAIDLLLSGNSEGGRTMNIENPLDLDYVESAIVNKFSDEIAEKGYSHQFSMIPRFPLTEALRKQLPKAYVGKPSNYNLSVSAATTQKVIEEDSADWENAVVFEITRSLFSRGQDIGSVTSVVKYYIRNKAQGVYAEARPYLYRSVTQSNGDMITSIRIIFDSSSKAFSTRITTTQCIPQDRF